MKFKIVPALFSVLIITATSCAPQMTRQTQNSQPSPTPNHNMHGMSHTNEVNERGDKVMGFEHTRTTHHFRLLPDGGAIEVEANDAADAASRDQIRKHLSHIAVLFADGDFNAPLLIHNQEPSGVPTMKKLKGEIKYQFEEREKGGRVHISTSNPEALAAIHDFLRFQIKDHQTGDVTEVQKAS